MRKLVWILIFLAINLPGKSQTAAWHGGLEFNLNFSSPKRGNSYDSITYNYDRDMNIWVRNRLRTKNWGQSRSIFDQGMFKIRNVINFLPTAERTEKGLVSSIKTNFIPQIPLPPISFDEKLGALAYLGGALEMHYGAGEPSFNDLVARMVAYQTGEDKTPIIGGDCRRYSFLVAKIAAEGMNLPAAVIGVRNHNMTQVIDNDRIVLLDYGSVIAHLDGELLKNKDDADAALARWTERLPVTDLTMDPLKNIVSYENRYNNFAGLFKKLRNEDNTLRQRSFLMDNQNLELFPQISEKGLVSGNIQWGSIGLQGYWLRENNRYNRFLDVIGGANLATSLTFKNIGGSKWSNFLFTDLGLYRQAMYLGFSDSGIDTQIEQRASTFNLKASVEDYLKYEITSHLTLGLITRFGSDQELARSGGNPRYGYTLGGNADENRALDGYILTSPFVTLVTGQTYLTIGTEITDYLSMPNLGQISYLPWFQVGLKKANFDTSLRGEFQPGSKRFDAISSLKFGSSFLKLKVFYENFTPEFKKYTLFQDVFGAEAEIAKGLGKYQIFFVASGKQENTGKTEIDLNLGFRF